MSFYVASMSWSIILLRSLVISWSVFYSVSCPVHHFILLNYYYFAKFAFLLLYMTYSCSFKAFVSFFCCTCLSLAHMSFFCSPLCSCSPSLPLSFSYINFCRITLAFLAYITPFPLAHTSNNLHKNFGRR